MAPFNGCWRIFLPMSKPILLTCTILIAYYAWNEFLYAIIFIDSDKCVGCCSCIMSCPYGALSRSEAGVIQKCELCKKNEFGMPLCVQGCPNKAIVYEER